MKVRRRTGEKEKNFVSAVVYAFNSESTISDFLDGIDEIFAEKFEHYELLVVNDASFDNTAEKVRSSRSRAGHLTLISLPFKHGVENAMLAGIDRSVGDFVFEFDVSSFCFPKQKIMESYELALKDGADIVAVSPERKRTLRSRFFYAVANKASQSGITLFPENFRLISRRAINAMLASREVVRYRKALYSLSGYKYLRIFYDEGHSSLLTRPIGEDISLALDFLLSYTTLIPRLSLLISALFFVFSICVGIYAIFQLIFNEQVVTGWTSIVLAMSFSFAGMFLFTALLAEYMYRILTEIKGRNQYAAAKVEDVR